MRRTLIVFAAVVSLASAASFAQSPHAGPPDRIPGLTAAGQVWLDSSGIAHVRATNEDDLFFAADAAGNEVRAESIWPGGTSGVLDSPFYFNMLPI